MPDPWTNGFKTPNTIVLGADGKLYGTANGNHDWSNMGGLFSMSLAGKLQNLAPYDLYTGWSFDPQSSENFANLVQLSDGTLLGINRNGGASDYYTPGGAAFKLSPDGDLVVVHTFYSQLGDATAPKTIALGPDGNIYGLTDAPPPDDGGPRSGGSLFKLTPGGDETILANFQARSPTSLLMGGAGDMYVALSEGTLPPGALNWLTGDGVYRISATGEGSLMHVLDAQAIEGRRIEDLAMDGDGNIIGSAQSGGTGGNGDGTLFKLRPSDSSFSVIHNFSSFLNGEFAPGDLMSGTDGSVYGVAQLGGSTSSSGALFRVARDGHYTLLHVMGNNVALEGANPRSLIPGGLRTIYGIVDGGANGTGAIFKLVVPIQDDLTGVGTSSLVVTGPGTLSTASATGTPRNFAVSAGYYPVAIGDFNGDGLADVLWTSANLDLYVWFGGKDAFSSKYVGPYPAGWSVVGAGDFNGDGMDDLAWINPTNHQFAYWLMNGAAPKGSKTLGYTAGYSPTAVGDYDGDGRADVLWSSAKHDLYAWFSHGQAFTSKFVANFPAGWKITGRGDLDGDGKADLVWSTTDGRQWGYWLMDGGSVRRAKSFAIPAVISGSHVAAIADYDGNGIADVLWSDGHALTLWENQGGCLGTPGCAFTTSVPTMTLPAGQSVFNSGLPVAQ